MKIKVINNGPYKVDAKVPLEREEIQADKEGRYIGDGSRAGTGLAISGDKGII